MPRRTHRASAIDPKTQSLTCTGYLVLNGRGDVRLSRVAPALSPGEVSMALKITVPLRLFSRPALKAEIKLPDNVGAADASADVVLDLKRALRSCPGVELKIAGS